MTLSFEGKGAHPIISGAGDATELRGWYGHIPFPTPEQLAVKRAQLLAQIEEDKAGEPVVVLARREPVRVSSRKVRRTMPTPPAAAA
jgi:hypothetical protein